MKMLKGKKKIIKAKYLKQEIVIHKYYEIFNPTLATYPTKLFSDVYLHKPKKF